MPLSRRELLAALGVGGLGGAMGSLERVTSGIAPTGHTLMVFERSFAALQAAARALPPPRLVDALTGQVAMLDILRRAASPTLRTAYSTLQARYAESLSWLSEEAGDLPGALYWTDRAAQWAQAVSWSPMVAYTFVRRSMMAISFAGDGPRAVDHAQTVLDMPDAAPRIKAMAAKQAAMGHALAGQQDDCARALDATMRWLATPAAGQEVPLGQRSVATDDLFAIYRSTCDTYLGRGASVIGLLEPRLDALSQASARTAVITRARLTRAYANAGQPEQASRLAWQTLDGIEAVGSLSARSELQRAVQVLRPWERRSDVQAVTHRLRATRSSGGEAG